MKREQLALGDTPNIAARLQGLAEPDTVVLSAATYRLIEGYFTCRDLGARALKGISLPVSVYQALGESDAHSRFEVAVNKGLTPLVGREQEVGLLVDRWEQIKAGTGQVVFLRGEAGIGKAEAEACFHKAIEIARHQGAKLWELRAVTSLSRLWHGQGKKDEARPMLAEIYSWFAEGFDTVDLQEAKALLEQLNQTARD